MEIPKSGYEIKSVKRVPGINPAIIIELIEDEEFDLNVALDDFSSHFQKALETMSSQKLYREENALIDDNGEKCFEIKSVGSNLIGITVCKAKTKEIQLEDFLEAYARKLEKEISKGGKNERN